MTHFAAGRSVGIDKVGAGAEAGEIGGKVRGTGLVSRRVEEGKFVRGADNLSIKDGENGETADEVVKRIEIIQPFAPELLNLGKWDEHTAKGNQYADHDRVDERGEDGVGRVGGNELANAGVDEFVEENDEEEGAGFV